MSRCPRRGIPDLLRNGYRCLDGSATLRGPYELFRRVNLACILENLLRRLVGAGVSHTARSEGARCSPVCNIGKGVGCMSGDNLWGIRGVVSTSRDVCCRGTLCFLPITSRSVTILQNFGREAGCCFQQSPMIRASSLVHGWLFGTSGLRRSSTVDE